MLTSVPQSLIVGHQTVPWAAISRYPSALMQERSRVPAADADKHAADRAMRALVLALWLLATPAWGQQITAFPAASTPLAGTEQIYLVQAGQPRQTTVGQLPFNVSGPSCRWLETRQSRDR